MCSLIFCVIILYNKNKDTYYWRKTNAKNDLNNNFIKEWKSAATLNLNRRNIGAVCAGTRKTCGNYIWRYKQ